MPGIEIESDGSVNAGVSLRELIKILGRTVWGDKQQDLCVSVDLPGENAKHYECDGIKAPE